MHAFDAQLATGTPQPVPEVVALDGTAAFIEVAHGTAGPWPHRPARVGLHAAEGASWLIELTGSGARGADGSRGTAPTCTGRRAICCSCCIAASPWTVCAARGTVPSWRIF